jgi:beta-galactosidase
MKFLTWFNAVIVRGILASVLWSLATGVTLQAGVSRERVLFNDDWRFARFGLQADGTRLPEPATNSIAGNLAVMDSDYDDSGWRRLELPHDWGIEGPFRVDLDGHTGKLPWRGIGWYRKNFILTGGNDGGRVCLDVDGAMANARVYCNGKYAGTWPYGYASFRIDLTPHVKFGVTNTLAVRLDTETLGSRWYPGAGLYRNVWLVTTRPVAVALWGTHITTPEINADSASVNLEVCVDNARGTEQATTVKAGIHEIGADGAIGKMVSEFTTARISIPAGKSGVANITARIPNPVLWDLKTPNRYVAVAQVYVDGKCVDTYETKFGIRSLKFTRDGFYLNGKRTPVKGVCMHHDLGALGSAVNVRALERQLEILRAMGCNAIRTSHNPPAPELVELADRMGVLLQVESFDAWKTKKKGGDYAKLWGAWREKDLSAMVRHFRNSPSVFMWSIGNEVIEQTNAGITRELAEIVRKLDNTRAITAACNIPDRARDSGAGLEVDCFGVNYFFDNQAKYDNDPRYAGKPTMGTETVGCASSRGEYFFDGATRQGFQVSSYDVEYPRWGCTPDRQFMLNAIYPHLWGEFVWTGFDYLGEPTPYNSDASNLLNFRDDPAKKAELEKELKRLSKKKPPSRSSYFGIVDLAGFPKDRYYLYQSQWLPEKPMAHILPHWNWPERVGANVPVHVYTSGDSGELFVNDISQGIKNMQAGRDFRLVWSNVVYQPGTVKVVVTKQGKPWAEETVRTTGEAKKLMMSADRSELNATDKTDLSFITVRVSDESGVTVPRTHNLIRFSIEGEGEIVATDNGNPISFESFQAPQRKAFNGLALVIVKAKQGAKAFTVKAEADGLLSANMLITVR